MRRAAQILLALVLVSCAGALLSPLFADLSAFGQHDWDAQAVYRFAALQSLFRYHEPPWWNPYLCGGVPSWGYSEGATSLVSPWLPAYMVLSLQGALRVEAIGSTLLALGTSWLLATRVTSSVALQGLVAALFALNGRWAMQLAVGHAWHLQYAWMPLALYFFLVAVEEDRWQSACWCGGVLALMVYTGGIYPLPHTALAMIVSAIVIAVSRRSTAPLGWTALSGLVGAGLSAPKLLPVLVFASQRPRLIDSPESMGLAQLLPAMVARDQDLASPAALMGQYGWHEWGIYVGWAGAAVLLTAALLATGYAARPWRWTGVLFLILGLGAFLPHAPWTLLHKLPLFSSQHVPSRFLLPATLMLSLAFAAWAAQYWDPLVRRKPWIDLACVLLIGVMAWDLAQVGERSTKEAFTLHASVPPRAEAFRHQRKPVAEYDRPGASWAGPSLLSALANTGYLDCQSVPDGAQPRGAIASDDPRYPGEAWLTDGTPARVVAWSPGHAEVELPEVSSGAVLVYNMNYGPGWTANGAPALEHEHAVAAAVTPGTRRVTFSYSAPGSHWGIFAFLLTAGAMIAMSYASRRK